MSGVINYALDANIFLISLTEELERLIMFGAELIILSDLFLLTGELEGDIVFGEVGGFYLRTVFVSACGAVEHFLFVVNYLQTLFADCMTAIKIPGYFLL